MPTKVYKYTGSHKAIRIFGQLVAKGKSFETESYKHQAEVEERKDFEEVKPEKAASPKKDAK